MTSETPPDGRTLWPDEETVLKLWKVLRPGDRQIVMRLLRSLATKPKAGKRHLGFVECWYCRTRDNCYLFQNRPRCRSCKRRHDVEGAVTVRGVG